MYFATYLQNGEEKIGVLTNDGSRIVELAAIGNITPPASMLEFVSFCTDGVINRIESFLEDKSQVEASSTAITEVKVCAPIPRPGKDILCLGLNYTEHVKESGSVTGSQTDIPQHPVFFGKRANFVIGPDDEIDGHKEITKELDYEVELAVIIGKDGTNIPLDQVEEHIFGYTILNDVTARDIQRKHGQWFKGKSLDTFAVMGPYLVHKSAIPFPVQLDLRSRVNGDLRQNSNTKHFLFDIPRVISELSQGCTLKAGDIIATGTPSGVGMGFNPPKYLRPGDVVECYIEKLGTLRNTVK